MDTSAIPNFITRKTAAERCKRTERSLQRYWSRAIELRDLTVLEHLKLRTEDGEITEGPEVTKKLIDKLKTQGRNPTWFAQAAWVEKTYGPRLTPKVEPSHVRDETNFVQQPAPVKAPHAADPEIVSILKEQLRQSHESHQEDKRAFREQITMLKEMFDTLKADHSDTKDLLRDVHKVFGNVSQAYLLAPRDSQTPSTVSKADSEPTGSRPAIVVEPNITAEEGIADTGSREDVPLPPSKPPSKQQSPHARRKKPAAEQQPQGGHSPKPRWYEMPTLKRLLPRSRK